jgi:hypothetical protein
MRRRRRGTVLGAALAAGLLAVGLIVAACGAGATPSPGDQLAAAFVDILSDPTLHASVVQQATSSAESGTDVLDVRTTMSGDLALPDARLEVVVETEGQATRVGVIVAGGRTYVDLGEGWTESPPGSTAGSEIATAFVVVSDPHDLELAGQVVEGGATLYHLVATRPLPYSPSGFEAAGASSGTIDDLDAYVEADGTPVRISFSFTAEQPADSGSTSTTLGTSEILFSNVGGDQVIVPPSPAPSLAPTLTPTASPATAP